MAQKVFKVVIPAAGLGIRMRPISMVLAKEMMPVGRKLLIQLAVEEAIAAGVWDICVVIRRGKEAIRDYLRWGRRHAFGNSTTKKLRGCKLTFVYQARRDGLGGALRVARPFVGREPFLMILPDQFLLGHNSSASRQLLAQYRFDQPAVLSSMVKIPKREIDYFRGCRGFITDGVSSRHPVPISRMQSEFQTRRSFARLPYEIRAFGRTVFPATIFSYLGAKFVNRHTGEIDLWKTYQKFPKEIPHFGCLLQGRACDVGTLDRYYHFLPSLVDR
jgi:UTP--glucose-1-phosphate uridylyltransferase